MPKEIVTALELGSHKHPSPARKEDPQPKRQFDPEDLKDLSYIGRVDMDEFQVAEIGK